ncbi:hypothetical protein IH982_02940 [Patescibacteria group bacterium]|nr:hypothetical protein [Patescibacteria group bacterium]
MGQQKKTFAVKLKGLAPWISEIQYEKEELDLTLYFTLKKNAEVNIIVEDGKTRGKLLSPIAAPLAPLSQKLISNVEYKPNSDLYITSLQRKDFEECRATSLALKGAVEELKQCGGENSSLLILFEAAGGTRGLLWSKRPEIREKVKALNKGTEKGNWVLFAATGTLASLRETFKAKL